VAVFVPKSANNFVFCLHLSSFVFSNLTFAWSISGLAPDHSLNIRILLQHALDNRPPFARLPSFFAGVGPDAVLFLGCAVYRRSQIVHPCAFLCQLQQRFPLVMPRRIKRNQQYRDCQQ
jgi:hypothetical protein